LSSSWFDKKKLNIDDQHVINIIQVINNKNEIIDGGEINYGDLILVKCHVCYYKSLWDKRHGLSLQLIEVILFFWGSQYIYKDEWHKNIFSISKILKTCNFVIERSNKF